MLDVGFPSQVTPYTLLVRNQMTLLRKSSNSQHKTQNAIKFSVIVWDVCPRSGSGTIVDPIYMYLKPYWTVIMSNRSIVWTNLNECL